MFDSAAALTPRSALLIEEELRRLLEAYAPVTFGPADVRCELAEDFQWHRRRPVSVARPSGEPAPESVHVADPEGEILARALAWDAQFEAGARQLAELRRAQMAISREQARQARALVSFARSRPVSLDRPDAEVGAAAAATRAGRPSVLAAVSEWAVDEVAVALGITGEAATTLLAESLKLVSALPGTLAALEDGRISWAHARVMADLVAPLGDEVRAEVEARLRSRVAGKTPVQLRVAARRVVARLAAEAITRRAAAAVRERRVSLYPGEDAMATVATVVPLPVARAVYDTLSQLADAVAGPGDERPKAQRMADCLVDLVLRPGEHGMAPVQAKLTIVAAVQTLLGGDEPGEVDGDVVPAAVVRELAVALGLLPAKGTQGQLGDETHADGAGCEADADADADSNAGSNADSDSHAGLDGGAGRGSGTHRRSSGGEAAVAARRAALADLLSVRRLTGTALAHRPHLALVDELSGALVALTDAAGLRHASLTGQGLGPPPPSPGYRPSDALDRYVRHRDRHCRFPGCRARPIRCDLDHTRPWPHGSTSAANLCCLCRHHHRLSHQAPGWHLRALADGGLRWTTPTGQVATTYPPGQGADDDLPPGGAPATQPPRRGRPTGGHPPPRAATVAGDLPPF